MGRLCVHKKKHTKSATFFVYEKIQRMKQIRENRECRHTGNFIMKSRLRKKNRVWPDMDSTRGIHILTKSFLEMQICELVLIENIHSHFHWKGKHP